MFEQITVSDEVKSLDKDVSGQSFKNAVITIENANIRWRTDAGSVTSTKGLLGVSGGIIVLSTNSAIKNFRAIRESGTDALLNVQYS